MIKNFVFMLYNGIRTLPGEFLADVPLLQQINDPDFHPKAYEWESGGQRFTRPIDGCDTLAASALPDGSGIALLQSERSYGSDNVALLGPTNVIHQRIINPYRLSKYFMAGDVFWFDAVTIQANEAALNIQVTRKLPGRPYDARPLYKAIYDPLSWKVTSLEWTPGT